MNSIQQFIIIIMILVSALLTALEFDDLKQEMNRDHFEVIEKIQRMGK